jgi:YVTN family beta-propeller protein
VRVISTASNTVTTNISFPADQGIAISPDGSRAYFIREFPPAGLAIIDTATNTVEAGSVTLGNDPLMLAVTPDGAFVYVTDGADNTVSVIDTSSNTVVATVAVGSTPFGIAIANTSTPFSNLTIKSLTVNPNGFAENGTFSLGANSTGIDLAHQSFTVTVNGFSLTIPGGSFKQVGGNMHFVFNGTINGTPVSVNLMATGGTSTNFKFSLSVTGVNLTGQPNPATVGLKIGSNSGSTTAPF